MPDRKKTATDAYSLPNRYPDFSKTKMVTLDILNKLTPYGLFKLTPIDNL